MTSQTFGQDVQGFTRKTNDLFSEVGVQVSGVLRAIGPHGRRFALTGFGAVLALSLGAATASVFRLPADIAAAAQAQDQSLTQSELPSEAAALAYALNNPPTYTAVASKTDQDPNPLDVEPNPTGTQKDESTPTAFTTPAGDPSPVAPRPVTPGPLASPAAVQPSGDPSSDKDAAAG